MIKINLLAEKKHVKPKTAGRVRGEKSDTGASLLLGGILLLGVVVAGGWWWTLNNQQKHWRAELVKADQELERLKEIRKKGEQYKQQKDLLARKIDLVTNLKKQQAVPVRILDQVSRNLPEFLWLDSMTANNNVITISGMATTYTAVSNFYENLKGSGYFQDVALGRTFEVPEGVSFSLTCRFASVADNKETAEVPQS